MPELQGGYEKQNLQKVPDAIVARRIVGTGEKKIETKNEGIFDDIDLADFETEARKVITKESERLQALENLSRPDEIKGHLPIFYNEKAIQEILPVAKRFYKSGISLEEAVNKAMALFAEEMVSDEDEKTVSQKKHADIF